MQQPDDSEHPAIAMLMRDFWVGTITYSAETHSQEYAEKGMYPDYARELLDLLGAGQYTTDLPLYMWSMVNSNKIIYATSGLFLPTEQ